MNLKQAIVLTALLCATLALPAAALEPIKIGMVAELTGANAKTGIPELEGAKLAVEEINKAGGVLGRPLELKITDSESTAPGSVLAFSQLVSAGGLAAVIGPVRSTQVLAMMPAILAAGIPTLIGGTDYTLTHANNPWVFRVRPHDGYSSKAIADFGVNTLKLKKWAIVHATDTFGIGGKTRLSEALQALGVTPVVVQSVNTGAQDFTPAVQAIKQSGADILATYITSASDAGVFAKQLRQQGVSGPWIGSASIATLTAIQEAGDALHGTYSTADFVAEANPEAQAFGKKYQKRFGAKPDHHPGWTYDAVNVIARAIKNGRSTKPEAVQKAIRSIRAHKGALGTYSYDQNGDGLHGYNMIKNDHGSIVFIKHIAFQPK
jgi:branched-chain amino acid transport system substrate-binding protein